MENQKNRPSQGSGVTSDDKRFKLFVRERHTSHYFPVMRKEQIYHKLKKIEREKQDLQGGNYKQKNIQMSNLSHTIIVDSATEFQIYFETVDRQEETEYGANMQIDGQFFGYIKTWKRRGNIFGFKLGGGSYQAMRFNTPQPELTQIQQIINRQAAQEQEAYMTLNTIEVFFYRTRKEITVRESFSQRSLKRQVYYKPNQGNVDDKLMNHPLNVAKGQSFHSITDGLRQQQSRFLNTYEATLLRSGKDLYSYRTYDPDEDQAIASIKIQYVDFFTALQRDYISLDKLEDFQYFPLSIFRNQEFGDQVLIATLQLILKEYPDGLSTQLLEDKFKRYTTHSLNDALVKNQYNTCKLFLQNHPNNFDSSIQHKIVYWTVRKEYKLSQNAIVQENSQYLQELPMSEGSVNQFYNNMSKTFCESNESEEDLDLSRSPKGVKENRLSFHQDVQNQAQNSQYDLFQAQEISPIGEDEDEMQQQVSVRYNEPDLQEIAEPSLIKLDKQKIVPNKYVCPAKLLKKRSDRDRYRIRQSNAQKFLRAAVIEL